MIKQIRESVCLRDVRCGQQGQFQQGTMAHPNYQIGEPICNTTGSGLYHALGLQDRMPVMLKLLDPASASASRSTFFRREYRLLQSLDIPEVIKPIALIDEHACLAMVVEDFAGESFESLLDRHVRMDLATALRIASHLSHALAGIHAAQVIHRDIRPANILVEPENGQVRIVDFSIATIQAHEAGAAAGCSAVTGDWAYFSPEQTGRMNCTMDYRTDFYSLGVLFYRMLTGQLPFQGNGPLEWVHCHIARVPSPPAAIVPDVPQTVSDIVMRLLSKLPEDRYQSALGLQVDIERCLAQWQADRRIEPFPLGMEDIPDRLQIPHKLYGRDVEIKTLLDTFDRMAADGRASLVTVTGYSGIGKSSLVHELQRPIVREHGYFISGKFDQYLRDIPYATVTQAFRELVQQLLAESEARIAGWRQQIQDAVGANGQLIVDVLPQVELIIGKQPPVPYLPPVEAHNRFHMVFRQFLGVFTRKDHPLVLFLDDLQWIDPASLKLIEHLLTHADTRYLLLIEAYRDNEVDAAHPLTASLDAIRNSGALVTDIQLHPLSVMDLNRLVADTLHAEMAACEPLTRLVFERTEGNPFFFTQFLDSLHKERLLQHDAKARTWKWDLGKIKARDFADNVVDLMVSKLRKLPMPSQEVLQLAACLGNKFNLRSLVAVSQIPDTDECLATAIHEGLIMRTDDVGKFLHDRIQQAAYSLIPEARREEIHLRIGRVFIATMTADEMAERLFDIANQLNHGAALLVDPDEKAQVAQINLRAGRKAKASAAYASACVYLAAGMALLDESCWGSRYELAFQLWLERANCEFLSGNFEIAEQLTTELLRRGASNIDKAAAYRLLVEIFEVKSENQRAVDSAIECLSLFGIAMSAHPRRDEVEAEYEKIWQNLGERTIESLIDLPLMTNPEMLAAMHMLSALFTPALFTDLNLVHLHLAHMANVTLKYGTTGAGMHGYAWLGLFLGPVFHRYADGYRFGKLAVDLIEKHGFPAYKTKLYLAMGLVAFWTQPIRKSVDFIRTAFDSGVEAGDLTFACYSCNNLITALLTRGDPLDEVWRESEKGLAFDRKVKFIDVADIVVSQQRFIQNMRGQTTQFSTFSDAQFDEAAFEAQLTGDRMATMVCWYWIIKTQARFMSGDYEAALAAAAKAQPLLWSSDAFIQLLDYHYYTALAVAAIHDSAPPARQGDLRTQLAAHREQLLEWAENGSATFFDKHALVAAEAARVERRDLDAMHLYEKAIRSARENGFVQNQGIAYELASGFYRMRGFDTFADAYLREARGCYVRWGADGKVRQLDDRHPRLRTQSALPSTGSQEGGVTELDLLAVAKASQAISGRIVLDELIDTLMCIVLENSGAQTGYLLLARSEELVPAAEARVDQQTIHVRLLQQQALSASPLPASILNYVRRSRERVQLADATQPHPFSADDYFARYQPKSVLCLPILRQAALIGMLYLENSLVTHAFTPERLTVLELLAAQAAISLENALLYTDLQQENSERKRAEETLLEREARIRSLVESNIIGIYFWNLQGDISDANDAFLHLIRYSRDELLSGSIHWSDLTPPEYRALDEQKIAEVQTTGTCTPYEKEYIRKDGTRVPVLLGATLFEGSQEQGVGFVLDLTEHKQGQAERQARQVAEAASRAKSAFLANMSHELRSPLNTILGFARLMERQPALPPGTREDLNIILRSGELLHTLINQVLDLSKIEAGHASLNEAAFDLERLLDELKDMFAVKAEDKGLQLAVERSPDLPRFVLADHIKLRQVLINLLTNALKFTQQGKVTLRARQCPPVQGSCRLAFEVADTGPGIAAHEIDSLFKAFVQAEAGRQAQEGSGLGLIISRSFVRLMGGDIHVDSLEGSGTTISFDIPVRIADAANLAALAHAPRRVVALAPAQPRYRILVADDRDEARQLLVRLLTPLGFEVREARNGQEAVEMWQAWHPHLIWMDMRMPVLDGYEATRRIRTMADSHSTTIIALTASSFEEERAAILAAGCDDFLRKPFLEDDLFSLMQKHLGARFIYQDEPGMTHAMPAQLNAALARLPSALSATLEQALLQLDTTEIHAAIAAIGAHDAVLTEALQGLANEFQYDQLLHLIQGTNEASDGKERT